MGIGIHPVIKDALRSADEKIVELEVLAGSALDGKVLHIIRLPSSIGVWYWPIKRENGWMAPITKETQILAGTSSWPRAPFTA